MDLETCFVYIVDVRLTMLLLCINEHGDFGKGSTGNQSFLIVPSEVTNPFLSSPT